MNRLTWKDLLTWSNEALGKVDIAFVHLLCAEGLPGAEGLDIDRCISQLNAIAAMVKEQTDALRSRYEANRDRFAYSDAQFRMICLITVLQRDLGIHTSDKLNREDPDCSNAEDLFLHGVLNGKGGNCSSLPVIYAAIGRRLGYPIRLSRTSAHLFARWEEPGERFNIECTVQGLDTPPDEYYLTWPFEATPEDISGGLFLYSHTPRRELAGFLIQRAYCLLHNDRHGEAIEACAGAWVVSPEEDLHRRSLARMIREWQRKLDDRLPRQFPRVVMAAPETRRYPPPIFAQMEHQILRLEALEQMLNNEIFEQRWWRSLRDDPHQWPADVPTQITLYPTPQPAFGSLR